MGNKIIFLNISYIIYNVKIYTTDHNFEKITTLASQLGSSGSDLGFHTRPT